MAKRWQNDPAYVSWLVSMNYVHEDKTLSMSDGIYIYMWEAWVAGAKSKTQTEENGNGTRGTIRDKKIKR